MRLGEEVGVLGTQQLIKDTTHKQMQRDGSLGKQGRSQKKEKKFKDPSLFKASPTPKLIIIKKEPLLGGARGGGRHLVPCQHLMLSGVSFFF